MGPLNVRKLGTPAAQMWDDGRMEASTIQPVSPTLRLGVLLGGVTLAMGVYTGVNYAVAETTPTRMLPSVIDDQIPFIAEAMLVYGGIYALALTPLCLLADRRVLARGALAYAILLGAALPVWVLWPVTVPREPIVVDDLWSWAVAFMRYVDPPANCFPSMHVGETVLAADVLAHGPHHRSGRVSSRARVVVHHGWTNMVRRRLFGDPRHRGRRSRVRWRLLPGRLCAAVAVAPALGGRIALVQFVIVARHGGSTSVHPFTPCRVTAHHTRYTRMPQPPSTRRLVAHKTATPRWQTLREASLTKQNQ